MLLLRNDCVQIMGSRNSLFSIAYKIDMQILQIFTIVLLKVFAEMMGARTVCSLLHAKFTYY